MKFSFPFLLQAYAVTYPVLVLAELAGARLPAIVSHANALGFFVAIMIGLLLTVEYGRPRRALRPLRRRRAAATLFPARGAFTHPDNAAHRPTFQPFAAAPVRLPGRQVSMRAHADARLHPLQGRAQS
ncbi:MAG TPA: hypothetical protein PKX00_10695 [Opitutaceae bacterium]|jgi:hypothetical protein|nr:hypothetical protein [Opitutaceae bacterium]HRE06068.1 hypothetical protein [Opitutaceae bacterium]